MPNPTFEIVIVNFNSGVWLSKVVSALKKQSFSDFSVIIVDNKSWDGSARNLEFNDDRFSLIELDDNLGFAAGNNLGFSRSKAEWFVTLNPDCVPTPNWLESISSAQKAYPEVEVFGSTQVSYDDPNLVDGFGDSLSFFGIPWKNMEGQPVADLPTKDTLVFSPCAAAAVYRRSAFISCGGFSEIFFCYLEDVELGWRLQRIGKSCLQVRSAIVFHKGSQTMGVGSTFSWYYTHRNRILMLRKNLPTLLFIFSCLIGSILYMPIVLLRLERGRRRAALKGIYDGVRMLPHVKQTNSKHLMGDFLRLLRNGFLTLNIAKISRKSILIRKS